MIREALAAIGLPITSDGVKHCRVEAERSYRRQLRIDLWRLVEEVSRTGQVIRSQDNETAFRELLEGRAILLYRNDEEWYNVNPAINGLESLTPRTPEPEAENSK